VKNAWSYTSTSQYAFMAWYLVKHRDNFTFTFLFYMGIKNQSLKIKEEQILNMIIKALGKYLDLG
jgi:hypothetical protein